MREHQRNIIAAGLFFLSGSVSLIFQVVWLKKLVLVFGNTIWAVSTLLTTFMAGLALGSWIFGRIADRSGSPLRVYGLLEGSVGVYGLLTPWIFYILPMFYIPLYRMSGGDTWVMGLCKFLLGFIVLLPPTICMGGTLPLLAKYFTQNMATAGTQIGRLYAINTFGAVFGIFFSGFFFIPFFGLLITLCIAAVLSLSIFGGSYWLTRGQSFARVLKISSPTQLLPDSFRKEHARSWILWIYLLCGFAGLGYEVLWNRVLVLHLGSSVYAYSVMLTIYLLGITLGSAIMSHYLHKVRNPLFLFAVLQICLAFDLLLIINQFGMLAETLGVLNRALGGQGYASHVFFLMLGVGQVLLIPTLLLGASFPVAVRLFVKNVGAVGKDTGVLYAFNTFGNILGAFLTGFVLLPVLGVQRSLLLIASLNLFIALYILGKLGTALATKGIVSGLLLIGFYGGYWLVTSPNQVILTAGVFLGSQHDQVSLLAVEEDVYATVTVEEHHEPRGKWRQLSLNGTNVAGTSCELFSIQKLQGHLPLLLHKDPKRVLHIGFGSGGTAWAVSRYPVESITIAEISKSVIQKASEYFLEINHGVLRDHRVQIVFTDGRNHVLAAEEKYDVILSDSVHPRFSGNGSLYTYEYYQLLKERLNPDGIISQWLPFYSLTPENFKMIIKSFYEVFPNTTIWYPNSTINEYVIVIGKLDGPLIDYATIERKLRIPEVMVDLEEIETTTPYKILDYFLFANENVGEFVADMPLHTDNNIAVEYISGRNVGRWQSSYSNYSNLLDARTSVKDYLSNLEQARESKENILSTLDLYEQTTDHNLQGQRLFWEGNREEAFQRFERIRELNPEDLEPVEYFGSSYQIPFLEYATIIGEN